MVGGEDLTFELFGLYNGVFAMKDQQTESVWSHLEGRALRGPLAGARMELLPLVHATWDEWRRLHPDTLVLSENTPGRYITAAAKSAAPGSAATSSALWSTSTCGCQGKALCWG